MPKNVVESKWYCPRSGGIYGRISWLPDDAKPGDRPKSKKRKAEVQTVKGAQATARQLRNELENDGSNALENDKITVSELASVYIDKRAVPPVYVGTVRHAGMDTWEEERRKVNFILGMMGRPKSPIRANARIRDITPNALQDFKIFFLQTPVEHKGGDGSISSTRDRGITSVNRYLATLRQMFTLAEGEDGWIRKNPFKHTRKLISTGDENHRGRICDYGEEIGLLDHCAAPPKDGRRRVREGRERLRRLIICIRDTGIRPKEMKRLTWQDLSIARRVIILPGPITKTKKERTVPITARLMREFEAMAGDKWTTYCQSTVGVKQTIFGGASWKTSWNTACGHLSIEGLNFYDLRHTFSTRLQELGLPSAFVSRLMGHSTPADKNVSPTTFIYTNVTEQMLDMARQFLDSEEPLRQDLRRAQQGTSVVGSGTQPLPDARSSSQPCNIADTVDSPVM